VDAVIGTLVADCAANLKLSLKIEVNYMTSTDAIRKFGNPGYKRGLPIWVGKFSEEQ